MKAGVRVIVDGRLSVYYTTAYAKSDRQRPTIDDMVGFDGRWSGAGEVGGQAAYYL